jgi:hypothetical protein
LVAFVDRARRGLPHWVKRPHPSVGTLLVTAGMLLVLARAVLWRGKLRSLLDDSGSAVVLLYSVLLSLTVAQNWPNVLAPSRYVAPSVVLAMPLVPRLPGAASVAYAVLAGHTSVWPLVNP